MLSDVSWFDFLIDLRKEKQYSFWLYVIYEYTLKCHFFILIWLDVIFMTRTNKSFKKKLEKKHAIVVLLKKNVQLLKWSCETIQWWRVKIGWSGCGGKVGRYIMLYHQRNTDEDEGTSADLDPCSLDRAAAACWALGLVVGGLCRVNDELYRDKIKIRERKVNFVHAVVTARNAMLPVLRFTMLWPMWIKEY